VQYDTSLMDGHALDGQLAGTVCGNPKLTTLFPGLYLRNRSTLDIGVLGYIGIFQHKEHSPEVFYIPPGTPCICLHDVHGIT
jgi:hypothetical protein